VSLANYPGDDIFVVTSASKTFNIPGLQGSYGFITDPVIRSKFLDLLKNKYALSCPSIFGMYGIIAAYRDCDDWLVELVSYLSDNMHWVAQFIQKHNLPMDFPKPQGTARKSNNIARRG